MSAYSVTRVEVRAGSLPARLRAWRRQRRHWIGWLFILPWFVGFLIFDLLAFLMSLYLSFTDASIGINMPKWVGTGNFHTLFATDHLIGKSFQNTVFYMVFSVPLLMITAFSIALLLNVEIRGRGVFRTIYYLPSLVPAVASAVIWGFIFRTKGGALNLILQSLGTAPVPWLSRPEWAKPALIIMSLWGFGSQMVIYLAGLQGISEELYEAARIDGANGLQMLRKVTIPLMTPTIFFNLIMGVIGAFQVFTAAYIMTNGGPLNATLFYMLHLYNNAFLYYKFGYASAMAILLFLAILCMTLMLNKTSGRWVHYTSG